MKNVLVTGGNGQLASCIRDLAYSLDNFNFVFIDLDELDITNTQAVNSYFEQGFSYCINCAAYTAVDKAETDKDTAERVNFHGAANLAKACKEDNAGLIQISTDLLFIKKRISFILNMLPTGMHMGHIQHIDLSLIK